MTPTGKQTPLGPGPLMGVPRPHQRDAAVIRGAGLSGLPVSAAIAAYPLTAAIMVGAVCTLYGTRGPQVVGSVLCYLVALSTIKLSVKWVFTQHNFQYAKLLSSVHFLSGALACLGIMLNRKWQQGGHIPSPTKSEFFLMIFPMSLTVAFSVGADNMALVFSSAAFTEIIGSTGCLSTIAAVVLMGMPFDKWLALPVAMVAVGCMISIVGEINFSGLGMSLCFASTIFRSLKVALQQRLMTGQTKEQLDPCALLFWISIPSTLAMFAASLMTEGFDPYRDLGNMDSTGFQGLLFAIVVSCVNAVTLNLAQLFVTKDLGAVGSQLIAQSKMVLTILGAMVIFGEPVTYLEAVGFAQVLFGVFLFSRIENQAKERKLQKQLLRTGGFAPDGPRA